VSGADWLDEALRRNNERRAVRYAEAAAAGAAYLVECRDLWDASDDDAGVYFVACHAETEVDALVAQDPLRDGDGVVRGPGDPVMGIYSVPHPLDAQGPGLTPAEWRAGERCYGASER